MLFINFIKLFVIFFVIIVSFIFVTQDHLLLENLYSLINKIFLTYCGFIFPIFIIMYAIGSIPFGLVTAYLFKTADPRTIGSGNIGATNMLRTGGKKAAALTFLGDCLKGVICCQIFDLTYAKTSESTLFFLFNYVKPDPLLITTCWLLIPVIAHIFPIWTNFKGGKGIATAVGVLLGFQWQLGIIGALIWIATFLLTRISSVAGITLALLTPVVSYCIVGPDYTYWTIPLSVIILLSHRTNILKLFHGVENRFQ